LIGSGVSWNSVANLNCTDDYSGALGRSNHATVALQFI
jgi:hypothetical protein